jgi:hypothetical protein
LDLGKNLLFVVYKPGLLVVFLFIKLKIEHLYHITGVVYEKKDVCRFEVPHPSSAIDARQRGLR